MSISPDLLRLIQLIEENVREAVKIGTSSPPEDIIKKNLRLLNVVITGADKDFIDLLPEVNKPEARQLFAKAREVFALYVQVYNQYLADRMHGVAEKEALEMATETMREERQPLTLS